MSHSMHYKSLSFRSWLFVFFFFAFTPVVKAAPTIYLFSADRLSIASGESVTLNWSVEGATSCTLTTPPPSRFVEIPTGSLSVTPARSTTYTLGCFDGEYTYASVPIRVYPRMDVTVDRTVVTEPGGGYVNFTWNQGDADTCSYTIYRAGYPADTHPARDWVDERFIREETRFRFECGYVGESMGPPMEITIQVTAGSFCRSEGSPVTWLTYALHRGEMKLREGFLSVGIKYFVILLLAIQEKLRSIARKMGLHFNQVQAVV